MATTATSSQIGPAERPVQVDEIFTLLESPDLSVVEDIHQLILENLSSSKESWLINTLMEYYFSTRSSRAQELLVEVREPLDKALIEKIQEGLRSVEARLQATQLLLYLVHHQAPWAHRLVSRPVFPLLLKCLKTEVDIPILMAGIMVLVIMLPVVPVSIEPHLPEILEVFSRVAGLCVRKPANSPDVFMLHLHVAVYVFFLRLYGMFPCTFLNFLRIHYAKKEQLHTYEEVIAPLLERVRLHPHLVTGNKESETSKTRWKHTEPQDIVVSCARMSLDMIEGTWEDLRCPIMPRKSPPVSSAMQLPSKEQFAGKPWQEKLKSVDHMFPVVVDATVSNFSPSLIIGLSTPPASQRATPAASFNELNVSLQPSSAASPQIVTPTPEVTPRETPFSPDDQEKFQPALNKLTPIPARMTATQKIMPSGVHSGHPNSAFVSPYRPLIQSGCKQNVEPSPIKAVSTETHNYPLHSGDSPSARMLQFDHPPESRCDSLPKHIEIKLEKDASKLSKVKVEMDEEGDSNQGILHHTTSEPAQALLRSTSGHDSDTLDLEVSHIIEAGDKFESSDSIGMADDMGPRNPRQLVTAQSVIQFMKKVNRIRFNSMTSHISEPSVYPQEKHARPGRARSCPPLRREPLVLATIFSRSPNASASNLNAGIGKLDTVSESAVAMDSYCNTKSGETSYSLGKSTLESMGQVGVGDSRVGQEVSPQCQACKHKCQHCVEGTAEVPQVIMEFATLFQCLLAPVRVAVCHQCYQPLVAIASHRENESQDTSSSGRDIWQKCIETETSLFSTYSPSELLDRHLSRGSELHAKELARIPLTSKDNISWTHFGGVPPADEVNILRGQILLLHNQLMYERHKRNNHAMRNRRLLRRIAHVTTLEEQVQALNDQLQAREKDVHSLQVSLKLLQDHNHRLQQLQDSDEYEKLVEFRTTIQQNKDLTESNVELKNLLLIQKAENDELKKEMQQVKANLFQIEKDNESLRRKLEVANKWKEQVLQLQKEVLLMGEVQERLQERVQQHRAMQPASMPHDHLVAALRAELDDLRQQKQYSLKIMEATQHRIDGLEKTINFRDISLSEIKRNYENSKASHSAEIQAVEEKYRSMLHINQQLEGQLLQSYAEIDCLKQQQHLAKASSRARTSCHNDSRECSMQTGPGHPNQGAPDQLKPLEGAAYIPSCDQPKQIASHDLEEQHMSPDYSSKTEQGRRESDRLKISIHPKDDKPDCEKTFSEMHGSGCTDTIKSQRNTTPSSSPSPVIINIISPFVPMSETRTIVQPVTNAMQSASSVDSCGQSRQADSHSSCQSSTGDQQSQHPPVTGKVSPAVSSASDSGAKSQVSSSEKQCHKTGPQIDTSSLSVEDSTATVTQAVLYTDSEDNHSQSSNSIITSDSGIFSKT